MIGLRVRAVFAALCVLAWWFLPAADPRELATASVRTWLIGDASPLPTLLGPERAATGAAVVWLPPTGDDTERSARIDRAAREWSRANGRDALPGVRLGIELRIGADGYRATLFDGATTAIHEVMRPPDRRSLLPALVAIVLALLTLRILPSLLVAGIVGGIAHRESLGAGIEHFVTVTLWQRTLRDEFSFQILGFVFALFVAVAWMTRSGGIQALVERLQRHAHGPVRAQLAAYATGLAIFFDDYTNCLVAGSTMRPLTDRNRVSREKLAYIVDSTAAPVAGLSLLSTWVAYEVSTFAPQLPEVTGVDGAPMTVDDGYAVFVASLPFRAYCIFALVFVALTIVLRREFGPMLAAQRRAWHDGKPLADDAKPLVSRSFAASSEHRAGARARDAVVPIVALLVVTFAAMALHGLYENGALALPDGLGVGESIRFVLGNGEPVWSLFLGSSVAAAAAGLMPLVRGATTPIELANTAARAAVALLPGIGILIFAWCLGHASRDDLQTGPFLAASVGHALDPTLLPVTLFLLAAGISFATGTSWGTMAILLPNVVVLAHALGETAPAIGGAMLVVLTVGAVLDGSIFGDHCSPISDTTVLASVGSGSDHLHHVRTQLPYAFVGMAAAIVFGYLPATLLGPQWWPVTLLAGCAALALFLRWFGRDPTAALDQSPK